MKGISILMAGAAIASLAFFAQPALADDASTSASAPTNAELEQRIEALEAELQASEVKEASTSDAVAKTQDSISSALSGWWDNTTIGGTSFFDLSNISHNSTNLVSGKPVTTKQPDDGTNFDLKRFYVAIDHKFNDMFSANVTTDVTYDSTTKASQIFLKKAYLQARFNDWFVVRVGSSDLAWVPYVESLYGYRYIENTLIDRTKFGTSTDWGAHVFGKFADGLINYQFSAVNGAGYKVIPVGAGVNRSKTIDLEGRIGLNWNGFNLGVGGYTGKLGKDIESPTPVTFHTANRFDAIAAYSTDDIHAGFEYFKANDWNNVTTKPPAPTDDSSGYGGFASYRFMPQFSVFGRYDYVTPNQNTAPLLHDNYYNFGVSYSPVKIIDFSLVYKHEQASHGSIVTSNGTIGGTVDGNYSEVGLFGQLKW